MWFSVRADLMSTGDKEDMANRVEGKFIASEFLGSLETDVFEVAPGQMSMLSSTGTRRTASTRLASAKSCAGTPSPAFCLADLRRRPEAA